MVSVNTLVSTVAFETSESRVQGSENENVAPGPSLASRPQATLVALDDRAADRQADAHAVALGRVEGVEELLEVSRGSMPTPESRTDSRTRLASSSSGGDQQSRADDRRSSFIASAALSDQIQNDLLKLDAIARDDGKLGIEIGSQDYAMR